MKYPKLLARLLVALLLLTTSANAAQNSLASGTFPTVSPYAGLTLVNNINSAFAAQISSNSGASAPSYETTGTLWANTSSNTMQFYNGSTSSPVGYFGGTQWIATSAGFQQVAITSTGSANAYVVTYSPAPTALVIGQEYKFITNFAVTGSATVNCNGLGALTLKKQGGTNLVSGDIGSGVVVQCVYDGTNCEITSQLTAVTGGTVNSGTANQLAYYAGTGTAISGTNALPTATTATTPSTGDNSTKVATTAFVQTAITPQVLIYAAGSGTYTTPTGATWLRVRMCGGGGGAGGSGSGAGSTGSAGGTTTFGSSYLTAGGGGYGSTNGTGGTGGTASGSGALNIAGGMGGAALYTGGSLNGGGQGGASAFGGGGSAGQNSAGNAGTAYCSGGGGGAGGGVFQGAGGGAGGYVEAWIYILPHKNICCT